MPCTLLFLFSSPRRLRFGHIAQPRDAELPHLDGQLEEVIQTVTVLASGANRSPFLDEWVDSPLALRLGLVHIISPHIHAMPPDEHGVRIRVAVHRLLQELGQVLLVRRVLDDRYPQRVVVSQVALLTEPAPEALDLLDVVDLEDAVALFRAGHAVASRRRGLEEQRHKDGPVRVRVDAAAGAALGKGGEEERRALRGLVAGRGAKVGAVLEGGFLRGEGEDVYVSRLHELLLDAGRRDVDEVAVHAMGQSGRDQLILVFP